LPAQALDTIVAGQTGILEVARKTSAHVRFGSKADMEALSPDVRFTPKSGHSRHYAVQQRIDIY
jgi:hypothetical protein